MLGWLHGGIEMKNGPCRLANQTWFCIHPSDRAVQSPARVITFGNPADFVQTTSITTPNKRKGGNSLPLAYSVNSLQSRAEIHCARAHTTWQCPVQVAG